MIASPHSDHTFFIDRNSGGRRFHGFLLEAGLKVVLHDEVFGQNNTVPDHEWLVTIGEKGWIIVSGDMRTVRNPLFLHAFSTSKALLFLLSDLNGSSAEKRAAYIVDAASKMVGLVTDAPRPAVWIFKAGKVSSIDWRDRLAKYEQWGRMKDVPR